MTLNDVVTPIEIVTYSVEEGTVNGHTVTRGPYATIHDACIALTVPYAQQVGGPILTHAVDTIGPTAEYWLHVHPDGQATPVTRHLDPVPVQTPPPPSESAPATPGTPVLPGVSLPARSTQDQRGQEPIPRLTLPEFSVPAFHAPKYPTFDEPEQGWSSHAGTAGAADENGSWSGSDATQQVSVGDITAAQPRLVGSDAVDPEAEVPTEAQVPTESEVPTDEVAGAPHREPTHAGAPIVEADPAGYGEANPARHVEADPAGHVEADPAGTVEAYPVQHVGIRSVGAGPDPAPGQHAAAPGAAADLQSFEAPAPPTALTAPAMSEPFHSDPALSEEAWPLAPAPTVGLEPALSPRPDIYAPQTGWHQPSPAATRSARRHAAGEAETPSPAPSEPTPSGPVPTTRQLPAVPEPAATVPAPAPAPAQTPAFAQTPAPAPAPASASASAPIVAPAPMWLPQAGPVPLMAPPTAGPTLDDLLAARPPLPTGPAQLGWRASIRRLSGGVISLRPTKFEMARRGAIAAVQRSLTGPKTVVVINPKGGANKTTATLLIAATFGIHRGGYTLAWDNNETRGTMGWRARQGRHTNTAVDLLRELDRFDDARDDGRSLRVGDLDNFVRGQGSAQFDVLASDEDATSAASIDAAAFGALHHSLSRFYRIMVVDTGNNMRASNWDAALDAADQIVIVSTIREDTAQSAAWVADALNEKGYHDKVAAAVTVLAAPGVKPDPALTARLRDHFGRLTRAVVQVPFDPALVAGGPIDIEALSSASRDAWLQATAQVADGL